MGDMDARMREQLECPVCVEPFTIPIFLCVNGHAVCGGCRGRITECGVCRARGKPARRCVNLENIAALVRPRLPCENLRNGCKQLLAEAEMQEHMAQCTYHGFGSCAECKNRTDALQSLVDHLMESHNAAVFSQTFVDVAGGIYNIPTSIFEDGNLPNLDAILFYDGNDNFWLHVSYNLETEILSSCVRLISNAETAGLRFQYDIEFQAVNSIRCLRQACQVFTLKDDIAADSHMKFLVPKGVCYADQGVAFTLAIKGL